MDIKKKIYRTLKKVFKKSKIKKNVEEIKLEQVKEWDSLKHFHLLLELEKEFNFRFSTDAFNKIKKIKDIILEIKKNVNSKKF